MKLNLPALSTLLATVALPASSTAENVIVTLQDSNNLPINVCSSLATTVEEGEVVHVYDRVFAGCAIGTSDVKSALGILTENPEVNSADEDAEVYINQTLPWGLDRINQVSLPLDNTATKVDATGVRVFVVDTGVKVCKILQIFLFVTLYYYYTKD